MNVEVWGAINQLDEDNNLQGANKSAWKLIRKELLVGRNPKVCKVCLGNAETTRHKCDGKFGGASCNDWLWGWFVVDDTVTRASKSSKVAQNPTP